MTRAVLIIAFNRPAHVERICRAVAAADVERVYVVCDGPRPDRPDDVAACAAVRAILGSFDFGCEVFTDLASANRGCRGNVVAALSWFFAAEAEGIVLEDDIVPAPEFFPFCWELLDRYRDVPEIWSIGGTNPVGGRTQSIEADYFYSRFFEVWGWASWRSRWQAYDPAMRDWPRCRRRFRVGHGLAGWAMTRQFRHYFDETFSGEIDTWDYQRVFEQCRGGGLTIYPRDWLVTNEGFGSDATHTSWPRPEWAPGPGAWRPGHPPVAPATIAPDRRIDEEIARWRFGANLKNVWQREHPTSFGHVSRCFAFLQGRREPTG